MNDFLSFVDPMFGLCFTFEPKKPVLASGPANGLKMRVYLNFHENLTEFNAIMGGVGGLIRIEKSSVKKIDHDDDGLYIETGKWHNIKMRRRFKTSLPRPYSNCEIDDDRSKYSQYDIYQTIQESPYHYSQSFCLKQCTQLKAINMCGCFNPFRVSIFQSSRACKNESEIECSHTISNITSNIQAECLLKCPLECSSTIFETTQTSSSLLGDPFIDYLRENQRLSSDFVTKPINSLTAKESFVKLSIFYDTLSYEMSKEFSKMNIVDLLANIGGTLSLFLGISILSLCELVELLIEIFYARRKT
jgi:hypothetical protein